MNALKFCADLLEFGSSAYTMNLSGVPSGEFEGIASEQFVGRDVVESVGLFIISHIDMLCDFDNFLFGQYDNGILTLTIGNYESV